MSNIMETKAFVLTLFILSFTAFIFSLINIINAETWKGFAFWAFILLSNGCGAIGYGLGYYFEFLEEKADVYTMYIEKLKYPALYGLILLLLFFLLNTAGY